MDVSFDFLSNAKTDTLGQSSGVNQSVVNDWLHCAENTVALAREMDFSSETSASDESSNLALMASDLIPATSPSGRSTFSNFSIGNSPFLLHSTSYRSLFAYSAKLLSHC